MDKEIAILVASIIFALVSLAHLLRLVTKIDVTIAGKRVPMWLSVFGFFVAGFMCIWLFSVR